MSSNHRVVSLFSLLSLLVSYALLVGAPATAAATVSTHQEVPARLGHLDAYRLDQVTLTGSHNTYQKKGKPGDVTGNAVRDQFHYLFDALGNVQTVEIDVWNLNSHWWVDHGLPYTYHLLPNDNNCPYDGLIGKTRNQDLNSCIAGLRRWHGRNAAHPLVIVKLELKNGFFGGTPAGLDALITRQLPRELIFTPGDLMCRNPPACSVQDPSPDAAAQAGHWPTMAQLRGKFMFVMVSGQPTQDVVGQAFFSDAPTRYASALNSGTAHLIFPSLLIRKAPAGSDPRRLQLCTPKTITWPLPFGLPSLKFSGCQGQVNYANDQLASWNVVFDMESGYLPSSANPSARTISAERLSWMRQRNYLIFVTDGHPAKPCAVGAADCLHRLTSIECPTADPACLAGWATATPEQQVDVVAGRIELNALAADYKVNVIDTDQESLGLFDPRAITGVDGQARWDRLALPAGMPASTFSPQVVSWGGGREEMFARLSDNAVWWRSFGPRGWTKWTSLGGSFTADPAAIAYDDGSLYVWALGSDHIPRAIRRIDGAWSTWMIFDRADRADAMLGLGARPLGDYVQLFGRGMDGALYQTLAYLRSGSAYPWQLIGGTITSAPRGISAGDPKSDVYALSGSELAHLTLFGDVTPAWDLIYPAATGAGVARGAGGVTELAFGAADHSVVRLRGDGTSWRFFGEEGVSTTADPGLVAWDTGDVDLFVCATDGTLRHRRFDGRLPR